MDKYSQKIQEVLECPWPVTHCTVFWLLNEISALLHSREAATWVQTTLFISHRFLPCKVAAGWPSFDGKHMAHTRYSKDKFSPKYFIPFINLPLFQTNSKCLSRIICCEQITWLFTHSTVRFSRTELKWRNKFGAIKSVDLLVKSVRFLRKFVCMLTSVTPKH